MLKFFVAGLASLLPLPSQAVVVDVTIRGTVSGNPALSSDMLDVFFGALTPGAAYTARFVYDTSVGVRSDTLLGLSADTLSGEFGDAYGIPIQGSLTLGGTRYNVMGGTFLPLVQDRGLAYVLPQDRPITIPDINGQDVIVIPNPIPNRAKYAVYAQSFDPTFMRSEYGWLDFSLGGPLGTFPDSLEASYTLRFPPNPNGSSGLPTAFGVWAYGFQDRITGAGGSSNATLGVSRITVQARTTPTPVPLPASAFMLIAAMFSLALFTRRARPLAV